MPTVAAKGAAMRSGERSPFFAIMYLFVGRIASAVASRPPVRRNISNPRLTAGVLFFIRIRFRIFNCDRDRVRRPFRDRRAVGWGWAPPCSSFTTADSVIDRSSNSVQRRLALQTPMPKLRRGSTFRSLNSIRGSGRYPKTSGPQDLRTPGPQDPRTSNPTSTTAAAGRQAERPAQCAASRRQVQPQG